MVCIWWAKFSSLFQTWMVLVNAARDFVLIQMLWVASFGPGHMCSILIEWKEEDWGLRDTTKNNLCKSISFRILLCNPNSMETEFIHFSKKKECSECNSFLLVEGNCVWWAEGPGQWAVNWKPLETLLSGALDTCWKRPLDTEAELCVWSPSTVSIKGGVMLSNKKAKRTTRFSARQKHCEL
jgi:hypothetical protein